MSSAGTRLGRRVRLGTPLVAVLLVLGLAGAMAITPTRDLLRQKDRISSMADDLRGTQVANRMLQARIHRLQDPDYIEQQARAQIGLVRPGETEFIVMPPAHRTRVERHRVRARAAAAKAAAARQEARKPGFLDGLLRFIGLG